MTFDLVIVGSGLVGATLACALHNQGLNNALIEKYPHKVQEDTVLNAKALALSLTSTECLKTLNVWSLVHQDALAILKVHTSMQGRFGINIICAKDYSVPALGYVVNADSLNQALNQTLVSLKQTKIFCPDEILELKKIKNSWKISLKSGKCIQASLLVGADGTESYLRKLCGIESKTYDYQSTAILFNLKLKQSHQNIAYERFTEEGSIAMLPFGDSRVKCVWILPNKKVNDLLQLEDSAFLAEVQQTFGQRLGKFQNLSNRHAYALKSCRAATVYEDRLVLLGNAANTLHPIAAQGFNLGLRDVATLAELVVAYKKEGKDIGSLSLLQAYAKARENDHLQTGLFSHNLAKSSFKNLGFILSEWFGPLKNKIAHLGMGKVDSLPKLCRGLTL